MCHVFVVSPMANGIGIDKILKLHITTYLSILSMKLNVKYDRSLRCIYLYAIYGHFQSDHNLYKTL